MIEILLNAVPVAAPSQERKTPSSLLDVILSSPRWKAGVCKLEARIPREDREQASLIRDLVTDKLGDLHYPSRAIQAFELCYFELLHNVFEHACRTEQDKAGVVVEITESCTTLTVQNPRGCDFDFESVLAKGSGPVAIDPLARRGRGFFWVRHLSDSLDATPDGLGLKAVFRSDNPTRQ
jgi:anti-sigma regulatory factor (Ser/Thr protein kinase)